MGMRPTIRAREAACCCRGKNVGDARQDAVVVHVFASLSRNRAEFIRARSWRARCLAKTTNLEFGTRLVQKEKARK